MANKRSGEKLYESITKYFVEKIVSEELAFGDKVMTEAEICEKFQVSRISATRALTELEKGGYITRHPGKGSFVSYSPVEHVVTGLYSLADEVQKRGRNPSFKITRLEEVPLRDIAPVERSFIQKKLFLQPDDHMYVLRRLRYADSIIMALDTTYIPVRYCPCLSAEEVERTGSLYDVMESKFGMGPTRAQEYFYAQSITDPEIADLLEVSLNTAAFVVRHVGYKNGEPVVFVHRIYKGDTYHYRVDLYEKNPSSTF